LEGGREVGQRDKKRKEGEGEMGHGEKREAGGLVGFAG
jgi:hypothetical protein